MEWEAPSGGAPAAGTSPWRWYYGNRGVPTEPPHAPLAPEAFCVLVAGSLAARASEMDDVGMTQVEMSSPSAFLAVLRYSVTHFTLSTSRWLVGSSQSRMSACGCTR